MKIGTIDTLHDRYSAEVLIQSKWKEPNLDGKKLEAETIDWDCYWSPKLSVDNVVGDPKDTAFYAVTYDTPPRHLATVCETRRVKGAFFEFMELNKFPFDSQDLTVTVTSDLDKSEVELVEDVENPSGVNAETFSCEQEWHLHRLVNVWHKTTTKRVNKNLVSMPSFCVAAKVSRRPQFFMWNIIVVMGVICSMAFVTFTVALETPQSRLQLTFILLLTTVTFKFVVNKSLPRISYLTYMDKYILGTMFILCCVCVWHAVVGSIIYPRSIASTAVTTYSTTTPSPPPSSPAFTHTPDENSSVVAATDLCTAAAAAAATASTTPAKPGPAALVADKIALGILGSAYVGFHAVFFVLIKCINRCKDETEPNIEVDVDKVCEILFLLLLNST